MKFQPDKLHLLKEIDSTNNYANSLIMSKTAEEGTVVLAYFQTGGRGQSGNKWESAPSENLLMSVVLNPGFLAVEDQFYLSVVVSLGIADYLSEELENVAIKWPNDIYCGNRKIAGILIENGITGHSITSSVAGIGLNVNQTDFSPGLPNPISMKGVTTNEYDLIETSGKVCNSLFNRYMQLKENKRDQLMQDYLKRLYRINGWHQFKSDQTIFEGRITGIGEYGKLLVENKTGQTAGYFFKEVEFVI